MHFSLFVRRQITVVALLGLCLLWAQTSVQALTFPANYPTIFYSPWNWNVTPQGTAIANQPGAYFQFTCSGSQSITLNLDLTGVAPLDNTNYMFVQWTNDGVFAGNAGISPPPVGQDPNVQHILLASNLKPGKHTIRFWLASTSVRFDRWTASALLADGTHAPAQSLRITGITVDAGATLPSTVGLQPHSMVFYGDSITEGYMVSPFHDATAAYTFACAQQLHAEFGVIGNTGQGWTITNAPATGVPLFPNSWNYYYQNAPRFPRASTAPPVDYVLVNMGANDGLCSDAASPARHTATTNVAGNFLTGIRNTYPHAHVFLVQPFGGFYVQAIQSAFAQYQQTHPQDHGVSLIDLGWTATIGLTGGGRATPQSYDGVHPNVATSQAIGFQLAAAVQTALGQYDFLGTGTSDLILQNNATGRIAFQSPHDTAIGAKIYASIMPPTGYQVVGAADFNGDGAPDLVLQNRTTGAILVWYMNGTTWLGNGTVSLKAPPGWLVVGVADFNNDGKADLVLQNTANNQVVVWYLNDVAVTSTVALSDTPVGGYQVVGVADFNRDGKPDLVLQSAASSQLVVWSLDGVRVTSRAVLPLPVPAGYRVESVADYFGDGRADLVLRNSTGALVVWRPGETGCLVATFATPKIDSAWHSVGPH